MRLVAETCRRRHERYHQGPVRGMTEGVDHQWLNCLFLVDVGVVGLYKQSVCLCVRVDVSVVDRAPNFTCSRESSRFVGQG